ncbi:hypothetical protein KIPB_016897, partial [Kipferlia bialata]|eukprot:g16897.t1
MCIHGKEEEQAVIDAHDL